MATKININGKLVSRPGVYTLIKSGIQNPPAVTPYGVIGIVDTGIGAGWGGGDGSKAYEFTTPQDMMNFVKGGPLYDLALPLFKPVPNQDLPGAGKVILVQARTGTSATITITCTNTVITLVTKDKGLNANGGDEGITGTLKTGYGAQLVAGKTTDTYIVKIYHGSYKGLDSLNNAPYDGTAASLCEPVLIAQSPEVTDGAGILAWLTSSIDVNTGFTYTVVDTDDGDLVPGDIQATITKATGATETYGVADFAASVLVAKTADCNFILSMDISSAANQNNATLLTDVILAGKYERFLWIAGYSTQAELATSIAAAKSWNSDKVVVFHGDGLTNMRNNQFKKRSVLWKTANVLGRLSGLTPETPLTFKKIGIDAEANPLTDDDQENALDNGVMVSYFDTEFGYDVVLQGINTLQANDYIVNDDGTSFSVTVKRIEAQLNKELSIYLKRKFFGNDLVGPNRSTVTEQDLEVAVEGYLQLRTDLIVKFQNITTTVTGDTYYVNYEFVPNYEINKFIVTGIILDK